MSGGILDKFRRRTAASLTRVIRRGRVVTIGVQGAVIDATGRLLLVRHGYRPGWHFPGGGLERDESAEVALRRELLEETGVIPAERPRLFSIYSHFDVYPGDHIVLYIIEAWQQPTVPPPSFEIAEQGFFAPDALPEGTSAGTRRRVQEIVRGATPAARW